MVLDRSIFKYNSQVLVEKVKIGTPFRYEAIFQNSGCFIYFKEKGHKLLSQEENIQIKSQEAVLLNCGSHFIDFLRKTDNQQVEVMVIHLYPDVLKSLYIEDLPSIIKKQTQNKQSKVIASSHVITKFIDSLEFYFQNPSLVNDDLLELKIKELILLLVQSKNVHSIQELINDLYSKKTVQLKKVIKTHLFSNLKLEDLAKLCHLSLSSFKREFKKEFNDSPNNYFNKKKLEKAKELLNITDISIGEIAYETGFNDPLYFTRFFKKRMGLSPTDYRKKNTD